MTISPLKLETLSKRITFYRVEIDYVIRSSSQSHSKIILSEIKSVELQSLFCVMSKTQ